MKTTHYKALMRKNWINWKRTPCGSFSELFCPIVLIGILIMLRGAFEATTIPASLMYQKAQLQTPLTFTSDNNMNQNLKQSYDFNSIFFDFIGKKVPGNPNGCAEEYGKPNSCPQWSKTFLDETVNSLTYRHCYEGQQNVRGRIDSTIIAYIHNDNNVAALMEKELQRLFEYQSEVASQKIRQYVMMQGGNVDTFNQTQLAGLALIQTPLLFEIRRFMSKDELSKYITDPGYRIQGMPGVCFAFAVNQTDEGFEAEIMINDQPAEGRWKGMPYQQLPVFDSFVGKPDSDSFDLYTNNGYSTLHNWLANFALRTTFKGTVDGKLPTISHLAVPMSSQSYIEDDFTQILNLLGFFIFNVFIVPLYRLSYRIVNEKETRARESMKMMGLTDTSYWLSWLSYYAIICTAITLIIVYMVSGLLKSNLVLFFLYVWIYGMSLFGLSLVIQSVFEKARTAGGVTATMYFVLSFFDNLVNQPSTPKFQRYIACLIPPVANNRIVFVISIAEQTVGLQWSNAFQEYQGFKVGVAMIINLISAVLFTALGLYLDNTVQQTYGTAKPWNFCLSRRFWCGSKIKRGSEVSPRVDQEVGTGDATADEDYYMDKKNYEPVVNPELKQQEADNAILQIRGLKKRFGDFQAVNGINLKMYNGQIFALLGHNGAGKTTTISMLTGLIPPTQGYAQVLGKSLFTEMDEVRKFMGVCPQHDVLFDLLTPQEHLEIFCDFKGVKSDKDKEINQILKDIDLYEKKDSRAEDLSGGNRRKLSVAIALVGGSKFILLDEPTAGLDLSARRKLWDMLMKYKANRIIIMSTHYMDEADILGDRIGIMAQGQIQCLGRPLFLKNRFGVGYKLQMVKKSKEPNTKVGEFLKKQLDSSVQMLSEVSSEIIFQIPKNLSGKFKTFFEEFDKSLDSIGIESYGISVTTLEEVFLRIGHGLEDESKKQDAKNTPQVFDDEIENYSMINQSYGFTAAKIKEQTQAIIKRRLQTYAKSPMSLFFEIIVPVALVAIGLAFSKVEFFRQSPPRPLVPEVYDLKQQILFNRDLINTNNGISPVNIMRGFDSDAFDLTMFYTANGVDRQNLSLSLLSFDNELVKTQAGSPPYRYGSYYMLEADNRTKSFKVATFLNLTSQDVTANFPQFMYEAILKSATGNPNFKFKVTTAPYPVSEVLKSRSRSANAIFICLVAGIGFSLLPASAIGNIVQEREKGLKHMQVLSGLSLLAYWVANLLFDLLKCLIPCVLVIFIIQLFDMGYEDSWVTILTFPLAIVPFSYASSFLFEQESVAQTVMLFSNIVAGTIGGIATFVLKIISTTANQGDNLSVYLKIFPTFSISNSIIYDSTKVTFNSTRRFAQIVDPKVNSISLDPWDLGNIGGDVAAIGLHFFLGLAIVILIEIGAFRWLVVLANSQEKKVKQEINLKPDEDVVEEEKRVEKLQPVDCLVRVNKLRKVYTSLHENPVVAVEGTSFSVEKGDCFALLGVNGCGKTTTFKSLTQGIIPTSGEVTVMGYDVQTEFDKARHYIGYCPQYDTIFDMLTVQEHLEYQAVIKGLPHAMREKLCQRAIINLNLADYTHKNAGTLSGGNKRKLSVAMALLGNPPVLLLDEPSAGMDPEARRFMWDVVANVSQHKKQSGVVITTHSMEEAEALSTKMGIQIKGGIFQCFGSALHVKNKFNTGYEIEVKFQTMQREELAKAREMFKIPDSEKIDLNVFIQKMVELKVDQYTISQLSESGSGHELFTEMKREGVVRVTDALQWLHTQTYGLSAIRFLAKEFQEVEILEQVNDFFKIKVPKSGKTIGYIFGSIENAKGNFRVSEYSVSQTTLEQIFQGFARVTVQGPVKKILFKHEPNSKQVSVSVHGTDSLVEDSNFASTLLSVLTQ